MASDLAALLDDIDPAIVALDMPIGLADTTPRACDRAARQLLGRPRSSSVFPVPTRAALAGQSHAQASDLNAAVCGKRVSAQAYNLVRKIRETDALLRGSAYWAARVYETHPEVTFAAMNAGRALVDSKKTAAGRGKRQALIAASFGPRAYANARAAVSRRDAADDDIADAFACLFTAERIARSAQVSLPKDAAFDSQGLPMRIVY